MLAYVFISSATSTCAHDDLPMLAYVFISSATSTCDHGDLSQSTSCFPAWPLHVWQGLSGTGKSQQPAPGLCARDSVRAKRMLGVSGPPSGVGCPQAACATAHIYAHACTNWLKRGELPPVRRNFLSAELELEARTICILIAPNMNTRPTVNIYLRTRYIFEISDIVKIQLYFVF